MINILNFIFWYISAFCSLTNDFCLQNLKSPNFYREISNTEDQRDLQFVVQYFPSICFGTKLERQITALCLSQQENADSLRMKEIPPLQVSAARPAGMHSSQKEESKHEIY